MEKIVVKYSIIEKNKFDVYYMDYYNNILSSSISIDHNDIEDIFKQFKKNNSLNSFHFYKKDRIHLK
jgi:hypothetical protein